MELVRPKSRLRHDGEVAKILVLFFIPEKVIYESKLRAWLICSYVLFVGGGRGEGVRDLLSVQCPVLFLVPSLYLGSANRAYTPLAFSPETITTSQPVHTVLPENSYFFLPHSHTYQYRKLAKMPLLSPGVFLK
jgi:hypothetical protein